ncbi:MAG: hypothetical protein KDK48_02720 [Chlamydiia bacterium]|nr:hypothetical protein [Chlamydiia bacterium]
MRRLRKKRISLAEVMNSLPPEITPDFLEGQFLAVCKDRYPSSDKVLQNVNLFGARSGYKEPLMQLRFKIIVIGIYRDLVRQMPRDEIFTSVQHRDDVLHAIVEAAEQLEEQHEELEEELFAEDFEEELE